MTRALILGRFQPPHLGHLHAIKAAASRHEEVLVVVGSAQESFTPPNPFTAGERVHMLDMALADEGLGKVRVYPVVDLNRHAQWAAYIGSLVPPFDVVVTNNPLTRLLFEAAGHRVEAVDMLRRDECSGTYLRKRLAEGADVGALVPDAVASELARLGAPRRLRMLQEADDAR